MVCAIEVLVWVIEAMVLKNLAVRMNKVTVTNDIVICRSFWSVVKNPESCGLKIFFWILHFVQNDCVK